jgi:hypothetical protein
VAAPVIGIVASNGTAFACSAHASGPLYKLVRRGDQGDLAQPAEHQVPVRQREHLR